MYHFLQAIRFLLVVFLLSLIPGFTHSVLAVDIIDVGDQFSTEVIDSGTGNETSSDSRYPPISSAKATAPASSPLNRGLAVLSNLSGGDGKGASGGGHYGIYAILAITVFSLAPAILVMITSFTRIIIVLHFVRRALGLQNVPPNQVLMGLAIFLTCFSMSGLIEHVATSAVLPYLEGTLKPMEALEICEKPVKSHLLSFVRDEDLNMLFDVSQIDVPDTPLQTPLSILIPAYILGELRAAFIIGLVIFLPFLAVDIIVAIVLQASGMSMLSPGTVSLPFKLLLFVLVDGWALIIGSLVRSVAVT